MTEDVSASANTSLIKPQQAIVLFAEITAIVSFSAFVISCIVVHLKFLQMGLLSWEIVNPQDFIVSTIDTLLAMIIIIFLNLSVYFISKSYLSNIINSISKSTAQVIFSILCIIILSLMITSIFGFYDLGDSPIITSMLVICIAILCPMVLNHKCLLDTKSFFIIFILFVLAALTYSLERSRHSYGTFWLATYSDGTVIPNCYPHVAWIGTESILINCNSSGPNYERRGFMLLRRDQVRLYDFDLYGKSGFFRQGAR